MKSLKDYSLNLSEREYHDLDAWSYSLIAKYAKDGFSSIGTLHEKTAPTPSMRFGSLFDCLLTRPEDARNEYEVMSYSVPEAEKKVLDTLATFTNTGFDYITDKQFQQAISMTEYQPRWKYETQYSHLIPYCDYFNAIASGKTCVSQEEWNDAMEMMNIVKNHDYLGKHFRRGEEDGVEYLYQEQFMVKYKSDEHGIIKMKIMPDMLEVNHNDKTIQPWDVKTSTAPGYDFTENFIKFRYDIQAALYTDVLQSVLNRTEEYKDYRILPYLFMDISRSDKEPVVFQYDPKSESQFDGLCYMVNERKYQYKNYKQLLDEILEYEKSNAKVPSYIRTDAPNDIISLLNK